MSTNNNNYLLLTLLALSAPTMAAEEETSVKDEQEQQSTQAIEVIEVTATKRSTSLLETPVAVSAFSQEDLDRQGVKNIIDIATSVPNMQIGLSPTDSGVQISVRGLSSNNFTELGDPTVAMHFDGIYSPRPQAGLALMYDVERAEISRGPQGTLFGRNTTAGSVNIISARPQFDYMTGKYEVEAGEYNLYSFKGALNVPVTDNFALRGSMFVEKSDAWLTQLKDTYDLAFDANQDGDYDDQYDIAPDGIPNVDQRRARDVSASDAYTSTDRFGFRISGRYAPTDDIDWLLIYDHFQDNSPGSLSIKDCDKAAGTYFACDHPYDEVAVNVPGEMDMTLKSIRSIFEWQVLDSLVVEHRLAYSQQSRFQVSDSSVGDYASPLHPAYGFSRKSVNGEFDFDSIVTNQGILDALGYSDSVMQPFDDIQQTTRYSNYDSIVSELQFKSTLDGPFQWLAGLFYLKEENEIQFEVEIPFCCSSIEPLAEAFVQPNREVTSIAGFTQLDYAVTEDLNVTLGYRYTHDKKSDTGGSIHRTVGFAGNTAGMYDPEGLNGDTFLSYIFFNNQYYQSDDLTNAMGTLNPDFVNRVPGTDNTHSNSWSQSTWKLGVDYQINENWFTYGYVATGFKAGGFGDAVFLCDLCGVTDTFDYEPETALTFEWGVKTSLLDGTLNLLGNVFVSEYKDLQQTTFATVAFQGDLVRAGDDVPDNDAFVACPEDEAGDTPRCEQVNRDIGTLLTDNISEARTIGFELEFDWYPWEGGHINGWYAYLDAEITDYETSDGWFCLERAYMGLTNCAPEDPNNVDAQGNALRTVNYAGNQLPWSPEHSITVNIEHDFYITDSMRLSPFLSVHWQDEMFFDNSNFDEGPYHSGQAAYATADFALRLIHEIDDWGLEFYLRNMTDERVRSWADRGPGFMKASFNKPRHMGVKFNMVF